MNILKSLSRNCVYIILKLSEYIDNIHKKNRINISKHIKNNLLRPK